ncbi:MAG: non-heme iron oxygenase ferredoxin subunit [Candidatus Binatota bacterium]
MAGFVKAAKTDEIAPGQSKMLEVNGKKIAIFNVAGSFHAIDDTCSHRGGSLSQGMIEGEKVTCPWHGAVFDVRSGEVLGPPAPKGVARYNVRVDGVQIEVEI